MSPFCRRCFGIARVGENRCPLDQEFYLRRDCPDCGQEVYPRELFCAHCRSSLQGAPETLLLPAEGSGGLMLASLLLDMLAMGLVTGAQFSRLPPVLMIALALLAGVVYRILGRAGGRQTFGQAVFHLLTVSRNAGPAGVGTCARRTLGEFLLLPLSLLRRGDALTSLDEFSHTYEVRLV